MIKRHSDIASLFLISALVSLSAQIFSVLCMLELKEASSAGRAIGGNLAVSLLPTLLMTTFFGNALDLFSKKKILALTTVSSVLVIGILYSLKIQIGARHSIFYLNVCTFFLSACSSITMLASLSMIPEIADRKHFASYNSTLQMARITIAMFIGWNGVDSVRNMGASLLMQIVIISLATATALTFFLRTGPALQASGKSGWQGFEFFKGFAGTFRSIMADEKLKTQMLLLIAYNFCSTAIVPVLPFMGGAKTRIPKRGKPLTLSSLFSTLYTDMH